MLFKRAFSLLMVFTFAILISCGKSKNEIKYDQITDVFRQNEDNLRALCVQDDIPPHQRDSMTWFTEDLLTLDYYDFIEKYNIKEEDEEGFLQAISVTKEIIETQNKFDTFLNSAKSIEENSGNNTK